MDEIIMKELNDENNVSIIFGYRAHVYEKMTRKQLHTQWYTRMLSHSMEKLCGAKQRKYD